MKKGFTRLSMIILVALCLSNFTLTATEPVFNIEDYSVCEDSTVDVEITIEDFTDMISCQFTIGWDPSIIEISEISYVNPVIDNNALFSTFDNETEKVTISWFDMDLAGKTISDNEVLFTITFNTVGANLGVSMVDFLDSETKETSSLENGEITVIPATYNNGMAMIAQPELAVANVTEDVNMQSVGAIDVTMNNGTAPYAYAWESGQTTEDITGLSVGDYTCVVTDDKGCVTNIGPFTVDNVVGTKNIEGLVGVQLYPNPSTGLVMLNAQFENALSIDISVYNIFGAKVYFEQIESANIELDLDLSDLAVGQYFVQMSSKDGSYVQKVQLQR